MRKATLFLLCAIASFSAEWLENYGEALNLAREQNKPVLAIVMRQTCPYCRKLIGETLPIKAINDKIENEFIPLMLDTEENPEQVAKSRLRANAVPASFILSPNGEIMATRIGYAPPMEFMRFLQND
ncbi:MAG: thioredoxin family protein [Helicobacteraceae bacterium]|jgi:thioredoxin-related protein|nr:thioredoxin family protein [Helicobacteraceae bacterium]